MTGKIHLFESAGLGKAPYLYTGAVDTGAYGNSTCCFCGTTLRYEYHLDSADKKHFHVGCECIMKSGDEGLRQDISADVRKHKKEMVEARNQKWIAWGDQMIFGQTEQSKIIRQALGLVWPNGGADCNDSTLSMMNMIVKMFTYAGTAKLAKTVRNAIKYLVKANVVVQSDVDTFMKGTQ